MSIYTGMSGGFNAPNVIPTEYKGIKFRSRLEARWAVFFDTLGIEWEYEPQGYEIGNGYMSDCHRYMYSDGTIEPEESREEAERVARIKSDITGVGVTIVDVFEPLGSLDPNLEWYLPDFWLPGLNVWAEVKGKFEWEELRTAVRAVDGFSRGIPRILPERDTKEPTGLLYLGDIPNPYRNSSTGSHVMFYNSKGAAPHYVRFRFNAKKDQVTLERSGYCVDGMAYDVYNVFDYDSVMSNYGRELARLSGLVVEGAPREIIGSRYDFNLKKMVSTDESIWEATDEYPWIGTDTFGEMVIEAGWKAARNAQF